MGSWSGNGALGYVVRKFPVLSETFVLNEVLGLEARGVPLHIFSLQEPNDPRFHEDLPKLKACVSYVPDFTEPSKLLRHHACFRRKHPQRYRRALYYTLRCARPGLWWRFIQAGYVASEARRLGIGHFHAQFANAPATVACLSSRMSGIPFSFTAHATDIYKHRVDPKALRRKVEDARFVVTVSEFNKKYLEELTGSRNGKIVRIYNGIDLRRFAPNGRPAPGRFRVLCVARLVEKKGHRVLIEAMKLLKERGLEVECELVGKGGLRSELEALIRERGLQDSVHLLGPRTQLEVLDRYHRAHLYVLPCLVASDGNREGLPVSIVESLACGLPVVTTAVTGIPEVVRDGENGILLPEADPKLVADAIESVIENPDLYRQLRNHARASVVPAFDRDLTAAELHHLLNGVAP